MSNTRLLTLILGLCLILLLIIWLISSLSWLYSQISWYAPPFLANLLVLLLIILIGIVILAFVYYLRLYITPKSKRRLNSKVKVKIPVVKSDAASESLKAVKQQVIQIQDEVARQALLSRSQEIEASLAQGNIKVVVFGTGSAGKTSLVNALIGRMVGRVEAPMGSTKVGETYNLKLSTLEREILITDTPGILEAGVAGTERGEMARVLATEANLLLFVVDNDLQQSEYIALKGLAEIGKRSLVVFNKIDLYTEEDKEAIMVKLRERLLGVVSKMDIVAIAAHPHSVRLETGEVFQPEADIKALIQRLAAVLRLEGEDLIADNILLQSQILGEEARGLIDAQRRKRGEKVVEKFQWIGAGVIAVTPLPVVDVLATAAVNAQMVIDIGNIYGCELNWERGQELAMSLAKTLAGLGIVEGAIKLISTALQLNLATFIIGKAIQGVSAAYLTRIAGNSFIEYFSQNQDWGDGGITEVVQKQFELTKKDEFVKLFLQDAIAKFVEPLTNIYSSDEEVETESEFSEEEAEINSQSQPSQKVYNFDDWETENRSKREDW
ncbi:GTP-binding protein [Okeania sp.]|uniref:YcjF family protein n=1 Tax=Okeania sp. TaxID=3100323 RepID=UPI002B4ADDD9|nr:GTP-binding protein [Okeania sp.]MEB3341856.1 GTP-binding protein [Okeania sp.]